MKIKILSLYPDLMNLYGSSGNIRCLLRHIEALGVEVELVKASVGDKIDFSDIDFAYMGAGTERSQRRALRDFLPYKEGFEAYLKEGGLALFCGNSFEMLGKKITLLSGEEIECLNLFSFETALRERRIVVDTVCSCRFLNAPVIGFMNKQSESTIVTTPLFRVSSGAGNSPDRNDEGLVSGGLFATQLAGPLLVRNPHLRAFIEQKLYEKKGFSLFPVSFANEERAYQESLAGLKK